MNYLSVQHALFYVQLFIFLSFCGFHYLPAMPSAISQIWFPANNYLPHIDLLNPISFFPYWQRHEERVIIISSKDNDEMVTDAEKALEQIATLILKVW